MPACHGHLPPAPPRIGFNRGARYLYIFPYAWRPQTCTWQEKDSANQASGYEIAPCNRSRSEVAWTFNDKGESPCFQWWNLGMSCYGWSLGPLTSNNTFYPVPTKQDNCACGALTYNLMAACTWCEDENFNSNWVTEKQWSTNCERFNTAGTDAFTGTRVFAKWAFAPNFGAKWDPKRSEQIARTGKVPQPSHKLSKGAIAGVVISVLVILACAGSIVLFLLRRRRVRQEKELTPDQYEAVLYNPNGGSPGLHRTNPSMSKGMIDTSIVAVTRATSTADASSPATTQAPAVVDADSIALAILRRVGHAPPGYTAPDASTSTSSIDPYPAYPPPSGGAASTPGHSQSPVSSQSHRKRNSLPPLPISKD